jgi:hypothetical protein
MEFDESWSIKQCETLHVTIKTSLHLFMNACQTPFCEVQSQICNFNTSHTITRQTLCQEDRDALHISLIEPQWVYKGIVNSMLVE